MFQPLRCPYRGCSQHRFPRPRFYVRHGSFHPKCRPRPVPRFRCRNCRRTFSRQSFRMDFRDHKPYLNAPLFSMIASGIGIRQCGRILHLSLRCVELKLRKIGRHSRRLNLNLQGNLTGDVSLHFDELETYEGQRNTRPLSVPVLLESYSRFIIWAEAAPIRPRGKMSNKRRKAIIESDKQHGRRKDLSRRSVVRAFSRGATLVKCSSSVTLETDEKSSYPGLARGSFRSQRLRHNKTNSRLFRGTWNPLFAVNNEEAIMRDLMGRLRRDSWLVSKKRRFLDLALQVHIAYRNLTRKRFNHDVESPAQVLGFLPRRLSPHEILGWRQDWGTESIHPLSHAGRRLIRRGKRDAIAA